MRSDLLPLLIFVGLAVLILILTTLVSQKLGPKFYSRSIMNRSETAIFRFMRSKLPPSWTIMTQVSYGAFLANKSRGRYMSINSKRADFVIVNPSLNVAGVFEYQGTGHYGRGAAARRRAMQSDKIKRRACQEAQLPLIEIPAQWDRNVLASELDMLVNPPQ